MSLMKSIVCGAAGGNCTATATAPSAACLDARHPSANRRIAPSRARKLRTGRWATGPGLITLTPRDVLYHDGPGYQDRLHLISSTPGPHTSNYRRWDRLGVGENLALTPAALQTRIGLGLRAESIMTIHLI